MTIDTNHVMVHDFNVTIDRNYMTKDDAGATTSMWDVTEIIWYLTFAPCDVMINNLLQGSEKGIRCLTPSMVMKS